MTTHTLIEPLAEAAQRALRAPSVFNTQPWRWRVTAGTLDLYADRERQLAVADPDGRLLTLSCGAALHHVRVALAAAGYRTAVTRFPEPGNPDLLARVRITGEQQPNPREIALNGAIPVRRTDRRAFADQTVPGAAIQALRAAVEAEGAFLHEVHPNQMPMLAAATARAAEDELDDPAYRDELHQWTHRPQWSGDGVPPATAVRPSPRRVPVREHAPGDDTVLDPGAGHDQGAAYTVLFGADDTPTSWLRAGEALSALLLTAVLEGLSAAPLSDTIELAWPRTLMRNLLGGVGEPYLVVRVGIGPDSGDLPPAPRRTPEDAIEVSDRPL